MDTSHERSKGHDEWLTPPELLQALGTFDLDPCSPINRPWPTAKVHYTKEDDGLSKPWFGRVWCNPPYGGEGHKWLKRCQAHANAMVLIFARTDSKYFHKYVFQKSDAIFFLRDRISFYTVKGTKADRAGVGSCLVAYGPENVDALRNCSLKGTLVINSKTDIQKEAAQLFIQF